MRTDIDEIEEDGATNQINKLYTMKTNNANPLLLNKGKSKSKPEKIQKNSKEIVNVKSNHGDTSSKLSINSSNTTKTQTSKKYNQQFQFDPSNEINAQERNDNLSGIGIPGVEVRNTLNKIKDKLKERNAKESQRNRNKSFETLQRHLTLNSIPPKLCKLDTFHTPCGKFKRYCREIYTNYFKYTLTVKPIYQQYIKVANVDKFFMKDQKFISQVEKCKAFKKQFAKDLNKYKNKKTLVLDLDETLAYSTIFESTNYDQIGYLEDSKNDEKIKFYIHFRPHLTEFLTLASEKYELILYTSSESYYANVIINSFEKSNKYFAHKLFKEHCIIKENYYVFKNLDILTYNRNIKDIIIIDNLVCNFFLFICNGIPIIDFKGNSSDIELCKVMGLLDEIYDADDVTELIKEHIVHFLLNNNVNKKNQF